jgi:hypothetical protein
VHCNGVGNHAKTGNSFAGERADATYLSQLTNGRNLSGRQTKC